MKTFATMRRTALQALVLTPTLIIGMSCTQLVEAPKDALTPSNTFKTDQEILAGVASVYASLRNMMWNYYNISEITTDEMIVPTRGQDWYDNGRWLELHKQAWTNSSGSAINDMDGMWNDLFGGVARANLMISVLNQSSAANKDQTVAELRVLRAWYYYMLQDMFGGVPLVTTTDVQQRARVSRDSIAKFIVAELTAARANLPDSWPADQSGRVTKYAADAILASVYVNAQVFYGTVTASGLTKGTQQWQNAIDAANRVINSGKYSMAANWSSNFSTDNHGSPENIFYVQHTSQPGLGESLPMRGLHYNELNVGGGPWNGFATLAETYRAFDNADVRKGMWLIGQQVSFDTGLPVNDRQGRPLIFTDTIGNETAAAENEGPRPNKFPPLTSAPAGDAHPNNFPYFRLAEMYLIRAEGENELGQTAAAITDVNIVRARAFPGQPGKLLSAGLTQSQVRDAIFAERLYELAGEAKRRTDMIRAGTYVAAHRFKPAREAFKILMPIPSTQIQSNPLLQQNPGY